MRSQCPRPRRSAGSLAVAAVPAPVHQCLTADADIVAAGAQFEALLAKWMPAWFDWACLHCEAKDEVEAKFGEQDGDNEAWTKPFLGTAPAALFKDEVLRRNGCGADRTGGRGDGEKTTSGRICCYIGITDVEPIDDWIAKQNEPLSRPEAIRRLVELGLRVTK